MFDNVPAEMQAFRQWICWKYVLRDDNTKPTKLPINPATGLVASVTDPNTWVNFNEACLVAHNYDGIGFVFTNDDPYSGIDLDDTHGDVTSYNTQLMIFREFDSYSELSPSGQGLHIIIRGKIPKGRRRSNIEIYSTERYFTMTGNVYNAKPIEDRSELLNDLWKQMGGEPIVYEYGEDQVERDSDETIIERATSAANGDKFSLLLHGDWSTLYPSQSEADFAFIDIVSFYTQSRTQIARIFHKSNLGQRNKAQRSGYIDYMINKSFDRQLPLLDIDGIRIKGEVALAGNGATIPGDTAAPLAQSAVHTQTAPSPTPDKLIFPPGLVGDVAQFIFDVSPRQVHQISLATAIALLAGITGRAYNVSGTGLNQYVLVIANTGAGKDVVSSGISKLMSYVKPSVPASNEFVGPGELVSSAGLIKSLAKCPAFVSVIGEFGLKLKEMSNGRNNANLAGLKRLLLQLYSKSGKGNVLDPIAYSDTAKNTNQVLSPSLTIIGESTPESFYGALDETMIADGILPRFMLFEHKGLNPYLSKSHYEARPSLALVEQLSALTAECLSRQQANEPRQVQLDEAASQMFDQFGDYATDMTNASQSEVTRQLWNRAHIKALKLSALIAVGINYLHPVITVHEAAYTIELVVAEVRSMIERFAAGDVGIMTTHNVDEYKQVKELGKLLHEWLDTRNEIAKSFKVDPKLRADGVFLFNSIQMKLFPNPLFKNDKYGATSAIKKAIQYFVDAGDIQEIGKSQMQAQFQMRARAFIVVNHQRFAEFARIN